MADSSALGLGLTLLTSALSTTATLTPGIQKDVVNGYQMPPVMLTKLRNSEGTLLEVAETYSRWAEEEGLPLDLRKRLKKAVIEIKEHYLDLLANPNIVWLVEKSSAAEQAKLRDQSAFLYFNGGPAAERGPKPFRFRPVKWMTSKAHQCEIIDKTLSETYNYLLKFRNLDEETLKSRNSIFNVHLQASTFGWSAPRLNGETGALRSEAAIDEEAASYHSGNEGTLYGAGEDPQIVKMEDGDAEADHSVEEGPATNCAFSGGKLADTTYPPPPSK